MRRGHHPNANRGWRNAEHSPRPFRPRSSGGPSFRPPRPFNVSFLPGPRYPLPWQNTPSNPRFQQYSSHYLNKDNYPSRDYPDHNRFHKDNTRAKGQNKHDEFDYQSHKIGVNPDVFSLHRKKNDNFLDCTSFKRGCERYQHNEPPPRHREVYNDYSEDFFEFEGSHSSERDVSPIETNELGAVPIREYTGHRPPASDHYQGDSGGSRETCDAFSKSIGDTVDIIKKRLMDRQETHVPSPAPPFSQTSEYVHAQHDQNQNVRGHTEKFRKPLQRVSKLSPSKPSVKENCHNMKSKIVHQLFRMDKKALRKFMDDPHSSTKFEFAINSLITESRNSLNKHLRATAEKSLPRNPDQYMSYEENNDTVYEDTFMKQMQCILDPRETILLTDIKPMVMAEINKVLQLAEYEQPAAFTEDDELFHSRVMEVENYHQNFSNNANLKEYSTEYFDLQPNVKTTITHFPESLNEPLSEANVPVIDAENHSQTYEGSESQTVYDDVCLDHPLPVGRGFKKEAHLTANDYRNTNVQSVNYDDRRVDLSLSERDGQNHVENHTVKENFDNHFNKRDYSQSINLIPQADVACAPIVPTKNTSRTERPLFEANTESVSEGEDPFAELDQQYHVEVDHEFSTLEDPIIQSKDRAFESELQNSVDHCAVESNSAKRLCFDTEHVQSNNDCDKAVHTNAFELCVIPLSHNSMSPVVKIETLSTYQSSRPIDKPENQKEIDTDIERIKLESDIVSIKTESVYGENANKEISLKKKDHVSHADKQIMKQNSLHRKEKSNKKNVNKTELKKKVLNKNIIINVNDCVGNNSENCDSSSSSVFNLFFSKRKRGGELCKDAKLKDTHIPCKENHLKRKEQAILSRKQLTLNRKKSTSSNEPSLHDNIAEVTQNIKGEIKSKLKPINMFEQPPTRKVHQSIRNTSLSFSEDSNQLNKTKSGPLKSWLNPKDKILIENSKKTAATQTDMEDLSKFCHKTDNLPDAILDESKTLVSQMCQTELKTSVKAIQTEEVSQNKPLSNSEDVLDRMKQIDLEIQALLQEKFKLYNSLESKEIAVQNLQTLGMTVLSVDPFQVQKPHNENLLEDLTQLSEDEADNISLIVHKPPDALTKQKLPNLKLSNMKRGKVKKPHWKTKKKSEDELITKHGFNNGDVITLQDLDVPSGAISNKKVAKDFKQKRRITRNSLSTQTDVARCLQNDAEFVLEDVDLIEQIVNDDRSLEDLIALGDLELPAVNEPITKKPKKSLKVTKPKKVIKLTTPRKPRKAAAKKMDFVMKTCSVVLQREDFIECLIPKPVELGPSVVVEELPLINEIHFHVDMMDVSEDIVIDGNYDVDKSIADRSIELFDDFTLTDYQTVSEEVVIDNSSSKLCEETLNTDTVQGGADCKTYDFSSEELCRDAIRVAGNADVLAIECIGSEFLAACLDGSVYHYNAEGRLLATLRGSNFAVTCLSIVEEKFGTTVYTGSLDSRIRYYDLQTGIEKGPECNVLSPIQTMDRAWDTIFVGTRTGFVLQFECKNNMLIPVSSVKFSEHSILALRALKEGSHKVLLVAARSESVTVKDAATGRLLRTLQAPAMTVYTLLYDDGKVYCGTSSHQIQVFDYESGGVVGVHEGGKGAVCLRAAGGLLLAGCYDGCVYVFRAGEREPRAQLRGPGIMLLSLALLGCKVIAGYKDRSLYIWKLPDSILQEMIL